MNNKEHRETHTMNNGAIESNYDETDLGEMECISEDDLLANIWPAKHNYIDNIMNIFRDTEWRQMNSYKKYKNYTNYSEFVHDLKKKKDQECTEFYLQDGSFLIKKTNDVHGCHFYIFYLLITDERNRYFEIGNCSDSEDVPRIVKHYLKTGECSSHDRATDNQDKIDLPLGLEWLAKTR